MSAAAGVLDAPIRALLGQLSPSGALLEVADAAEAQRQLDLELAHFDAVEAACARHLAEQTLVSRLEDDFARAVPQVVDGATALEGFLIPIVASLAGPAAAPFLSFGLQVACKVALSVLQAWAARRLAQKVSVPK